MTSQDELRRRIECLMINAETRNGGKGTYASAAQAVIDDLGLEVVSDGGRPEWKLQVIGKWEKQ